MTHLCALAHGHRGIGCPHCGPVIECTAVAENRLITLLTRLDRARLLALCEPVELVLADVLNEAGKPTRHAYFPVEGFVSLLTTVPGHASLEVGMVGWEGMVGAELVLGVSTAPLKALVQGAGSAWRISGQAFQSELKCSVSLQRVLNRYVYTSISRLATSAACLRYHLIGPRLARWLLMTQDRAQADSFYVTQEFLASMLGVRRVGVTAAAGKLQRSGLISYTRGRLSVLDRQGLESAACSCYATDRDSYVRVM